MDEKMNTLGVNFKNIRTQIGYTQEQVATYLNLDRTLLTKFEKGERKIGVSALEKACDLFGCTLAEMDGQKEYVPILTEFRAKVLTTDDMEAVSQVQKIVLNLRTLKVMQNVI